MSELSTYINAQNGYRQFLRDLPQNHDSANDAADAWNEFTIPN